MKILFKKKKKISLESLHESDISPYKDWLRIISIFSIIVIISAIVSGIYSYNLFSGAVFQPDYSGNTSSNTSRPSINIADLQSAVDFISSRAVNLPATTTVTSTPKK